MELPFLQELREVTARVRAGETLSLEELGRLKAENRRRAEEAEREDREICDSLPTWINTTNSTVCNLKCGFCPQAYGKGVDWKMPEPIYQRVIEELYPATEIVQLSAYGEPMMTPKIHDKIADMERFGIKLEMVSNLTLMKGDKLVERMARVMGLLTVSMDGATKQTYDGLRVGADFDQVMANIRNYNHFRHQLPEADRAPLHFQFILMKRTASELSDFMRLAQDLDAQHVTISHLVLMEKDFEDEMMGNDRSSKLEANEAISRARQTAEELDLSVNLPPLFEVDEPEASTEPSASASPGSEGPPRTPEIRCWFLWQRLYVGTFGDVVPCCLAGIHANGSVKEESDFFTEWNSDMYRMMRRQVHSKHPYGPCRTCYLINRSSDTGDFDPAEKGGPAGEQDQADVSSTESGPGEVR